MQVPYLEYFGLTEKPFSLTPDPSFYFESRSHREALDHLDFFLEQREGFALVYGDVGTGKTTLSRIFIRSLDPGLYATALILNPVMDERAFLREVLAEFSVPVPDDPLIAGLEALKAFLLERHGKGKRTIVAIDEAQLIRDELFEFIRVLSNFETDKEKILQIVFFAQPEIMDRLQSDRMRYLSQRITVIYELKSLDGDEVARYVSYRLFTAGSKALPQFDERAVRLIASASQGYPRLVNIVADRCMLLLYARSKGVVNRAIARKALEELNITLISARRKKYSNRIYLTVALAVFALLCLFWWDFLTLYRAVFSQP